MYHMTRAVMQKYLAPEGDGGGGGGGDGGTGGAGGGGNGGTGGDQYTPEAARSWLQERIPDPDYVKALPEDKLKPLYEKTQEAWKKAGNSDDPWRGIRQEYATKDGKVDDKVLARLGRYATPHDAINALFSVQNRISAGEFRSVLPKDANDDQVTAWRAENGIPAAPDKYELKLKDGLVVGEEDKPVIDTFLKSAHGANMTSQQASQAVDWYYEEVERQTAARADADKQLAQKAQDQLRADWGQEYRTNENLVMGLLDSAPTGVKDLVLHGRLADGTPIMSHPDTVKWLNQLAREINPVTAIIPNAGGNISGAIEDEIKQYETWMRAPRDSAEGKKYWADTKVQERLRALYGAREKAGAKK